VSLLPKFIKTTNGDITRSRPNLDLG